ncbi:MAG: hypothetical protein CM15mP74_28810 [Halieaceae bacterium]|nr:MAG: hypothetical protein CM15mP74_28810 [Halieaceae bacterium]
MLRRVFANALGHCRAGWLRGRLHCRNRPCGTSRSLDHSRGWRTTRRPASLWAKWHRHIRSNWALKSTARYSSYPYRRGRWYRLAM